jgi:tetratricopeptide (TPR) repeat protein
MTSLGRDETETAVVLYNNWALELDQVGRPLEAEKLYKHVIDISRDNDTEAAVSDMVLNNYARVMRELHHLPEAADYAERAYDKALKTKDDVVISQSLLERSRIYLAEHDTSRSESMLEQVEPRLHQMLPPGHYALAAIPRIRGLIALEKHDPANALRLMDQSISMIQSSVKAGHEGNYLLPVLYIERSAIDLALGRASDAEADANQALATVNANDNSSAVSSRIGGAYLAKARALVAQGKSAESRAAASQAVMSLQGSLGTDHPDTQSAKLLAG